MRQILLSCCLALFALAARAEVVDIDNAELERLVKQGVPLIDIRTQPEWEETGIISGSRLLTFFDERGNHNDPAWLEKLKPLAQSSTPVILICRSGKRSAIASQFLAQQAGYSKVYNVKGGITAWKGQVVPAATSIAACRSNRTC